MFKHKNIKMENSLETIKIFLRNDFGEAVENEQKREIRNGYSQRNAKNFIMLQHRIAGLF